MRLARAREKDREKIESRIEILMNGGASNEDSEEESPELDLFDDEG
jgi:hypothetical protein